MNANQARTECHSRDTRPFELSRSLSVWWAQKICRPGFVFIRVNWPFVSQHESLPFEPRMFEIEDDSDRKCGDSEIVEHLPAFMIRNPVNRLRVDDQLPLHYQIRNILSDQLTLIQHAMPFLLRVSNPAQPKLHAKTILINLLVQPVAPNVQNFNGAANDCVNLSAESIRVY